MSSFALCDRLIDPAAPVVVIAEAGVNHNGSLDMARELVVAAREAGADVVKFQTFDTGRLAADTAPKAAYQAQGESDAAESQAAMLRALELPLEAWPRLAALAREQGLLFMSTPFDRESLRIIDALDPPAIKLGSGDLTNHPLVRAAARTSRPLILSAGMATLAEVTAAVEVARGAGAAEVAVLQCTTDYPAPPEEANLRAIPAMGQALGIPIGFSDHTAGYSLAVAAVALGASIVEKHLTLDRSLDGPDHAASLDPAQMAEYVARIREIEGALGDGVRRPTPSEEQYRALVRRSLAAASDLPPGRVLEDTDLDALRPGTGIPPEHAEEIVGRRTRRPLARGQLLAWDDLE